VAVYRVAHALAKPETTVQRLSRSKNSRKALSREQVARLRAGQGDMGRANPGIGTHFYTCTGHYGVEERPKVVWCSVEGLCMCCISSRSQPVQAAMNRLTGKRPVRPRAASAPRAALQPGAIFRTGRSSQKLDQLARSEQTRSLRRSSQRSVAATVFGTARLHADGVSERLAIAALSSVIRMCRSERAQQR
jgi:hypothetical protein